MKNLMLVWAFVLALASPAAAQITVPHTLADLETIDAARLNTNFSTIAGDACNRTGCTMTGTLTTQAVVAAANDTYDLGTNGTRFQDAFFSGTVTAQTSTFATNTVIGGTLGVTGITTLTGNLVANGTTDINSTFTVGSGNVQPFSAGGKIQAISSTYFDSLDGTNLTGVAKIASANTYTARNNFLSYSETFSQPAIAGGALTVDAAAGSWAIVVLNQNITSFAVSNVEAAKMVAITVLFVGDATPRSVVWPATIRWAASAEPTMSGGYDFVTLVTADGGLNWWGFIGGLNFVP